ncbi:ATP-grasp fold subdomain 1 [Penicillium paradoxum]|uniref:ATP-grasp fold subdomain 1 n=1 Tax=Penicillium paradoxum TaxID=176176 RepID=UPI002547CDF8|nr:ATP-grasp fold subdomain 1 [Penicillium paradoxum]KAJ5779587.1 ATP-grasp fold subdomain 1 [Penicillium paradoxum]
MDTSPEIRLSLVTYIQEKDKMRTPRDTGLNIAFTYDPIADYLECGYSETDCADLADEVTANAIMSALRRRILEGNEPER